MFVYIVHDMTAKRSVRIVTDGDPTVHPCFFGHDLSVETLGMEGELLSIVK
jgi:hypothetical protein